MTFLAKKFGDLKMTIFGLFFSINGLLLIAFSNVEWLLNPTMVIYVIGSMQSTGFQNIDAFFVPKKTNRANFKEVGAVFLDWQPVSRPRY